ncbi:hypothetical protein P7K49_014052 [Saguinus oedipus]|uniref:Uncharacterized protein n=1 Tax=Saguinus oedipus TaxID=9490 RepID=A0ABQ9VHQ6_SAGOE|nr:hypothetical protein P7K49_014052 [Saguinus oedipus]
MSAKHKYIRLVYSPAQKITGKKDVYAWALTVVPLPLHRALPQTWVCLFIVIATDDVMSESHTGKMKWITSSDICDALNLAATLPRHSEIHIGFTSGDHLHSVFANN